MFENFWVIMPVYNEEEALPKVLDEWILEFREHFGTNYTFCVLNDGSKDNTYQIIEEYAKKNPEIRAINKANSGHGQSCIYGYKMALKEKADWVFQIDSDGQCTPSYFKEFLAKASLNKACYGYRKTREDGLQRIIVSRFVTLFVWAATGIWVRDANVPYRLMPAQTLKNIVNKVPKAFHLSNILISCHQKKSWGIDWIDIHFRDRMGGLASVKTFSFVKQGFSLFKELKSYRKSGML